MKEIFAGLKGMNIIEDTVTIKPALADGQEAQIEKLAESDCRNHVKKQNQK